MSDRSPESDIFKAALLKIVRCINLPEKESYELFQGMVDGRAPDTVIAGLLTGLAVKGETYEELAGAARALRARAAKIHVAAPVVVDICGTGGDIRRTFNISTAAALVAAGAGAVVAKHGNPAIALHCGSTDILEVCGVDIQASPETIERCIAVHGIGFMPATTFHAPFRTTLPIRRALGIRTIFNMLGPLVNPAGANCVILGVFSGELTEMVARTLRTLSVASAMVVYGHDGMDEISIFAPTRITELRNEEIRTYNLDPRIYFPGEPPGTFDELCVDRTEENVRILRGVLDGTITGACRNIVLLNAGAALYMAGLAPDPREGIRQARTAIDSGAAIGKLDALIEFTRRPPPRD